MKIGIVGYQGSGKSTLFHWLTGQVPDPALAHTSQSAMATIPDPRVAQLCEIYKPKKITEAALEIVDTVIGCEHKNLSVLVQQWTRSVKQVAPCFQISLGQTQNTCIEGTDEWHVLFARKSAQA